MKVFSGLIVHSLLESGAFPDPRLRDVEPRVLGSPCDVEDMTAHMHVIASIPVIVTTSVYVIAKIPVHT